MTLFKNVKFYLLYSQGPVGGAECTTKTNFQEIVMEKNGYNVAVVKIELMMYVQDGMEP